MTSRPYDPSRRVIVTSVNNGLTTYSLPMPHRSVAHFIQVMEGLGYVCTTSDAPPASRIGAGTSLGDSQ